MLLLCGLFMWQAPGIAYSFAIHPQDIIRCDWLGPTAPEGTRVPSDLLRERRRLLVEQKITTPQQCEQFFKDGRGRELVLSWERYERERNTSVIRAIVALLTTLGIAALVGMIIWIGIRKSQIRTKLNEALQPAPAQSPAEW